MCTAVLQMVLVKIVMHWYSRANMLPVAVTQLLLKGLSPSHAPIKNAFLSFGEAAQEYIEVWPLGYQNSSSSCHPIHRKQANNIKSRILCFNGMHGLKAI